MHPGKWLKTPLNRSGAWFLALSDSHPHRKQQAKPSKHATARMHPASDRQSKPSKPKGKPLQMIRQGFALVSDTIKAKKKPSTRPG